MSIRYVDADILDSLANDSASARNELRSILNQMEGRVNSAPRTGWNGGTWSDVRYLLNTTISDLDHDQSALHNRAGRVRIVAAERALMAWIQGLVGSGERAVESLYLSQRQAHDLINALDMFDQLLPAIVLRGMGLTGRLTMQGGKLIVAGGDTLRSMTHFGAATRMNPLTAAGKFGRGVLMLSPARILLEICFTWADNEVEYGAESHSKAAAATLADLGIKFAGAAVIGGAILLFAPVSIPVALGVGLLVAGTVYGIPAVRKWVTNTAAYQDFINDPVKATGDFAQWSASKVSNAAQAVGHTIDDTRSAVAKFAVDTGKRVDQAISSTVASVSKPLQNMESFFGSINPMKAFQVA